MDAAERKEILGRYLTHSRHFEEVAARRRGLVGGDVIPLQTPVRALEQEPTLREVEVLQLISDGLVNRGNRRAALPVGGDGEVACASPAREAASALAGSCRGRRVAPRAHRVAPLSTRRVKTQSAGCTPGAS